MKKQIPTLITALSLVFAISGISIGIAANRQKNAAQEEANSLRMQLALEKAPLPEAPIPPTPLHQEALVNTNALAQLEAELAALNAELAAAKANQTPPREDWGDRIARMKEEDPEGYAEMVKNREERQQTIRYDLAERTASFMDLDTAFMTDAERENHDLLIEKMADVWELTDQFQDPEQAPNREAMRDLFSAINEARPLMDAERSTMFRQLANDLGYDTEEAQAFSGYVEEIITTTTIEQPRGRRGGGR